MKSKNALSFDMPISLPTCNRNDTPKIKLETADMNPLRKELKGNVPTNTT